ncbi:MAG: CAP domain-containing protein [Corynebacterium sp.]|nr:CAP domain-containing protein [Corynebacterium sp.]
MKKYFKRASRAVLGILAAATFVAGSAATPAHAEGSSFFELSSGLSAASGNGAEYINRPYSELTTEQAVLGLHAAYEKWRADRGLYVPQSNDYLDKAQQKWTDYLASTKQFFHSKPGETAPADVGENLWMGGGNYTPQDSINSWQNSKGHYRHMVQRQITQVGFGVSKASDGTFYVGLMSNWYQNRIFPSSMDLTERQGYYRACTKINEYRKANGLGNVNCYSADTADIDRYAFFVLPTDFTAKGYETGIERALKNEDVQWLIKDAPDGGTLHITKVYPKNRDGLPFMWISFMDRERGKGGQTDADNKCNGQLMFDDTEAAYAKNQQIAFCEFKLDEWKD